MKIGQANDRTTKAESEYVWALRDINFTVQPGEVLGIIGRNGAGKSTLLKILSRITAPTTGNVILRGRVAALLEVGTGMHPELTGRENIYLNGAILGMRKKEIDRKFEEIVDFSGVERYIDTPVKRYSSGMHVRLGFAVAAHLEPDILIVDEVLAVGDIEFQKKCLGKMKEVSGEDGRTVLFVSHNMQAIAGLCQKVLIVANGQSVFLGDTEVGITKYIDNNRDQIKIAGIKTAKEINTDNFKLILFKTVQDGREADIFKSDLPIQIEFIYCIKMSLEGIRIGFDIYERKNDLILFRSFHDDNYDSLQGTAPGYYKSVATIPANLLKEGSYEIRASIGIHNKNWITHNELSILFDLKKISGFNTLYGDQRPGVIMPLIQWDTTNSGAQ